MRIRALILAVAVIVSGGMQMRAQMSGPPPSPPVGTKEDPAKAVDGLLSIDGVPGSGRGEGNASR